MIDRRHFLAAPAIALLASCGGPPPPAVVELRLKAGADQNPDSTGRPVAVATRLYLLNAAGRFQGADIFALTERERATLGEDNAGMEEVVLRPGESREMKLHPRSGVRYLGAATLFRDIDRARWRALAPLAASGPTRLTLTIKGTQMTLAPS